MSSDIGAGAQPISEIIAPPSKDETAAQQKTKELTSEAEKQLKESASTAKDLQAHLADVPKPEDFGLTPKDLEAMQPTKSPSYKPDNPLQDFGGMASLIGIFGGMLSRRPLVTSLNAASGAMQAYHQRNLEDYDKQVEEWKNNTDYISKVMDWREKAYDIADKQFQNDLAKKSAAYQMISAASGDTLKAASLAQGDWQMLYQQRMDSAKIKAQWDETNARLSQAAAEKGQTLALAMARGWKPTVLSMKDGSFINGERNEVTGEYRDTQFKDVPSEQVKSALTGPAATQALTMDDLTPDDPRIKAIAEYKAAPGSMWGANTPYATKLMDAVLKANPKYDTAGWTQHLDVVNDFAKGPSAQRMDAINAVVQHFDLIQKAAVELRNTNFRPSNELKQTWARTFGSSIPTSFAGMSQIVSQEANAVILGRGRGTVDERTAAQASILSKANSLDQIIDGSDSLKGLMAGQANALRQRWLSAPGLSAEDFDKKLTPAALVAMRQHGFENGAGGGKDTDPLGLFGPATGGAADPLGIR